MEGTRKFQISVEYKTYCLFIEPRVFLKLKLICQIWRQIQMERLKVIGKVCLRHPRKKPVFCLYSFIVSFILKLFSHMFINSNKLIPWKKRVTF